MADISFSQAERRSYAIPALIAFAILLIGVGIFFWRTPMRAVDLSVPRTATMPTHTVFATGTKLVGAADSAEDVYYVLATLHIHNNLRVPIFIKDITGTFTSADDAVVTSSAVEKADLPNLYVSFPALKPLSSTPLYRESSIQPGGDGEGMVVFGFPIDQATWDKRKSATITVDLYHPGQFTTEIAKTAPSAK
jgi:hypothetical protein